MKLQSDGSGHVKALWNMLCGQMRLFFAYMLSADLHFLCGIGFSWNFAQNASSIVENWASLMAQLVKNLPAMQETPVQFLSQEVCWRRDRLHILIFLGFPCSSAGKESACNARDLGLIPGLGRSPGEGKGYPFRYSGLENSMDCIVHGFAKSWIQLSDFHFTSQKLELWLVKLNPLKTNLDSILKSRDITLLTKVRLVKAMVFPVVMYGCEGWTIKKAECRRIDAFELWCWRRLLRVP